MIMQTTINMLAFQKMAKTISVMLAQVRQCHVVLNKHYAYNYNLVHVLQGKKTL